MLDQAVEDSRKQKRRGTPNAVVLAGMSLPSLFVIPLQMPKNHVRFLHKLRRDVRARAGMAPPKLEIKVDEGARPPSCSCCGPLAVAVHMHQGSRRHNALCSQAPVRAPAGTRTLPRHPGLDGVAP